MVSVLVDGPIVCTLGRCPGGIFCPGGTPGDIFCLQRKLGEGERRKRRREDPDGVQGSGSYYVFRPYFTPVPVPLNKFPLLPN